MRAWVLILCAGCTVETLPGVGATDAGRRDAAVRDSGPADSGVRLDAGFPDSGPRDLGVVPTCTCPPLPTCGAVAAESPVFSEDPAAFQAQLYGFMACADAYLRIAIYEADWPCAISALESQLERDTDLVLKVVIDEDRCPQENGVYRCPWSRLVGHPRVTLINDGRSRYMHHKFMIADGQRVWVSSANWTRGSLCQDWNDALVIEDPTIVGAYETHFARLFNERNFGPSARTPPIAAGDYQVSFGPQSPLNQAPLWWENILSAIQTASVSVDVASFAWTRQDAAQALLAARQRGVQVRALVSHLYAAESPAQSLMAAGVPVKVGPIHSKMMIVDGQKVFTGSANWSDNAWENNEDSLQLTGASVNAYTAEFTRAWAAARDP